ncbi:MAG TPA: AAA family ATPase, partial [Bacillota bacterium]|nr:AAA family ATPase [Bacillota bacterium]
MRLLRLEINGFKSFAHKVKVNFEPGITAIIGPNGSGKSNIVDAIRWVLGEQSAKSLRGNKMEDVIFIGSERRKPLGMAEVSLILDNSDGTLNLPYQEVCIRRRVFRSGEGEYSINGKTARLRDLTELFMNTGLGRDDYSIIDQRKVEAVLGSKPQDRRLLLEEAAGIYKYRVKREETLRKLAETEDNSLRLRDILSELTARLRPLRIEAARAQEAKKLDEEIARLSLWLL